MIQDLIIKDFALIDTLHISFSEGLNIITGETGAGKSIIISALHLLLGGKISPNLVQQGKEEARLEASFAFENASLKNEVEKYLRKAEIALDDLLIIKRIFTKNKINKIFINNSLVPLSFLEELGTMLADFTSQHEHTYLLKPSHYIDIIDIFGSLADEARSFEALYLQFKLQHKELAQAHAAYTHAKTQEETRTAQLTELQVGQLKPGEYERLEEDLMRAENQKEILDHAKSIVHLFEEEPTVIIHSLRKVRESLTKLSPFQPKLTSYINEVDTILSFSHELIKDVEAFASSVDISASEIETMNERLILLNTLKKKFMVHNMEELIKLRDELMSKVNEIEVYRERSTALEVAIDETKKALIQKAKTLNKKRESAAKKFDAEVIKELQDLGFFAVAFSSHLEADVPVDPLLFTKYANARVNFLISLNPGQKLFPLHTVVSGGELSRILLAIKLTLKGKDNLIDTFIFDEIDTGIGGITANTIGMKLKKASEQNQCICITHLPHIAKYAETHFSVIKSVHTQETHIDIQKLTKTESKKELARMLGNKEASLAIVEELMST